MRRSGIFLLTVVAFASTLAVESQAQSLMTRHVREAIRNGQALSSGQLPADQIMNLNIVMPLGVEAGAVYGEVWPQPGRLRCGGSLRQDERLHRDWRQPRRDECADSRSCFRC